MTATAVSRRTGSIRGKIYARLVLLFAAMLLGTAWYLWHSLRSIAEQTSAASASLRDEARELEQMMAFFAPPDDPPGLRAATAARD